MFLDLTHTCTGGWGHRWARGEIGGGGVRPPTAGCPAKIRQGVRAVTVYGVRGGEK